MSTISNGAEGEEIARASEELQQRLRSGEPCRAEEWLAASPGLAADPQAALDLIYDEYATRLELHQKQLAEEFYRRFPQWRSVLRHQFHFHSWLREALAEDSAGPPPTLRSSPPGSAPSEPGEDDWDSSCKILGEVGRGGMGVVYRAWQQPLKRVVAVKTLRAGAGKDDLARLRTEAEAAARLQHPNIVQVYEVGQRDGTPYLVLECLDGGTLAERLAEGPLPAREAARLILHLARAVQHAHDRGVVHRDLKPANVLLTADGQPKITDFGLARLVSQDPGAAEPGGRLLGTPRYMAPEQARGDDGPVGPAADIHALGVLLYEALTGRPPFQGETVRKTLQLVQGRPPVRPRCLCPQVPRDLEAICLKCLQKEPARRYASAGELADDLERFLDGRSVRARTSGPLESLGRYCRRHPGLVPLTAALILVTALCLIGGVWQWCRAEGFRRAIDDHAAECPAGPALEYAPRHTPAPGPNAAPNGTPSRKTRPEILFRAAGSRPVATALMLDEPA